MIKISFVGPESSGKSTLAKTLASRLNCPLIHEYAREYLENTKKYSFSDLNKIAVEQAARFQNSIKKKDKYLIADTCLVDIEIWSEAKYKVLDPKIEELSKSEIFDIYFLCKPDIPWEADPLRENPKKRDDLFKKFNKKLTQRNLNYFIVKGNLENRLTFCLDIISRNK